MASSAPRTRPTPRCAATTTTDAALLRDVLPGVSRSFALSLRILPAPLRAPFGVTYLVARAADTLADTRARPPAMRQADLARLQEAIRGRAPDPADLGRDVAADHPAAERRLLARLPAVLAAYRALDPADRARAEAVLLTLTGAMQATLARFPPEDSGRVEALDTLADLDWYTYGNAGCVGEFWTDMVVAHRPRCAGWDVPAMRARGVRFGQGLQLVNVLRDLPRDLRGGRCYLPRTELAPLGLGPADLLDPGALPRVRPLLARLAAQVRADLEDGRTYTLVLPRREWRLRLACAWPWLLGLATLARLERADALLDPAVTVKVPRAELRRLLVGSTARVASNRALAAYARRLAAGAP
jgi:farnesyl-diphosphate farnesyltransferase